MTERNATQAEAATRLLELIQIRLISESIHVAAALGVADLLTDEPKTVEQVAEATGVSAPSLRCVMRALASFSVFSEDSANRFSLAPMGELLRRDLAGSLNAPALFFGGETGASTLRLFLECIKTGESATEKLSGGKRLSQNKCINTRSELISWN